MRYYTVTEGRANRLDLLRLRDRSTYGLNWMVLYASSDPDAIRQWEQFKSGTHLRQAELEAEAAEYRAASQGYAPPWQAEREVVAAEAAERVRAEQVALRARGRPRCNTPRLRGDRHAATDGPPPTARCDVVEQGRGSSTSAKPTKRGGRKARDTAKKRRRR